MPVDWEYRINLESPEADRFTPAQLEIIRAVANGKSVIEIAESTGRSPKTVMNIIFGNRIPASSRSSRGIVGILEPLGFLRKITSVAVYAITSDLVVDHTNKYPADQVI